jgi:hypothetical protein
MMPTGDKVIMKPDDVCWIRRPHPLDPYLSLTPLEASGVAIEIENLAKLYNRNYLLNDGRPGGLLVVRGEIDDDDKEELRNRFRGNLSKAGHTTVISSDDGVDFVDTSASPRDAAYIQMRQITKEEILSAFGVPESVIGNASGRTFSNAAEEIRVFWMETMLPHLEPLARGLDELDDKYYLDFDTSEVPILMLYKQERDRYLLQEFQTGLISANEYRTGSSRKEVEADLADSLLMNPNLIPIANTKKKMEENQAMMGEQQGMPGQPPGMPGMPPGMPGMPPGMPGQPGMEGAPPPLDPNTMQGAIAESMAGQATPPAGDLAQTTIPSEAITQGMPQQQMATAGERQASIETKSLSETYDEKCQTAIERWSEILARSIERLLERQQRVVMEKSSGAKAKKALSAGTLDIEQVLAVDVWNRQMEDDIKPVLTSIINDSFDSRKEFKSENGIKVKSIPTIDVVKTIESHLMKIKSLNSDISSEIYNLMIKSFDFSNEEERLRAFRQGIGEMYANLLAHDQFEIAESEARSVWLFAQTV